MNTIWIVAGCALGVLALVGEWLAGRRARVVCELLEQQPDAETREKKRLYRLLFGTSVLALFFGLALAAVHRQSSSPVQGVAFVLDTNALPGTDDPSHQLSIEKAAMMELIRALPGVALSLYELRGGVIHPVVPPTVDRLFFELQLDGVLPSPSAIGNVTLDALSKEVKSWYPVAPPWVVVVSPATLSSREKDLDGLAKISVQQEAALCDLYESGQMVAGRTLKQSALKILERVNATSEPSGPDAIESLLLTASTGISLLCFVLWRRAHPPICALGLMLLVCSRAFSITDEGANVMVQDAMHLAQAQDYTASQATVESLLTSVADSQARQRLLYDRALLSYLQGRDGEALRWLEMESKEAIQRTVPEAETLRGLVLTRMVTSSTDEEEQLQRKEVLREWLTARPRTAPEVRAAAMLALISTSVRNTLLDNVGRTLRWLAMNAQETDRQQASAFFAAARLIAERQMTRVERVLRTTWPGEVTALFSRSMGRKDEPISTMGIWVDFARAPTQNEAVAFLLDQAALSANRAMFFPKTASEASIEISLIETILAAVAPALPDHSRRSLRKLLDVSSGGRERGAAIWYVRSVLWPALQLEDAHRLKAMALALSQQVDLALSQTVRKTLATIARSMCSLPGNSFEEADPLEEVMQTAFSSWYSQDPSDALDAILLLVDTDPQRWSGRFTAFVEPSIQRAKKDGPSLPRIVALGIGDELKMFDPVLTGRLWQIVQIPSETPQEVGQDVDHLVLLFSELLSRLGSPSDSSLRAMVLLFSVQPHLFDELKGADIFQKNPQKRLVYEQLLDEWNDLCLDVRQRIEEPSTFRLPKVRQQIESCAAVLRRLQALLNESQVQPEGGHSHIERPAEAGLSVRKEDVIRLFQEMDRSDRELYGES